MSFDPAKLRTSVLIFLLTTPDAVLDSFDPPIGDDVREDAVKVLLESRLTSIANELDRRIPVPE